MLRLFSFEFKKAKRTEKKNQTRHVIDQWTSPPPLPPSPSSPPSPTPSPPQPPPTASPSPPPTPPSPLSPSTPTPSATPPPPAPSSAATDPVAEPADTPPPETTTTVDRSSVATTAPLEAAAVGTVIGMRDQKRSRLDRPGIWLSIWFSRFCAGLPFRIVATLLSRGSSLISLRPDGRANYVNLNTGLKCKAPVSSDLGYAMPIEVAGSGYV